MLVASVASLYAGSVTLAWDASAGTNVIAYYSIYWVRGTNATFTTNNANAAGKLSVTNKLTCTVSNLTAGAWTFTATAYSTNGLESANSNVVWTNLLPGVVTNLRFQ